jgi:hypothetical protein
VAVGLLVEAIVAPSVWQLQCSHGSAPCAWPLSPCMKKNEFGKKYISWMAMQQSVPSMGESSRCSRSRRSDSPRQDEHVIDATETHKALLERALIGDIHGLGGRARYVRECGRDRHAIIGLSARMTFREALVVRVKHRMTGYAQVVRQGARVVGPRASEACYPARTNMATTDAGGSVNHVWTSSSPYDV